MCRLTLKNILSLLVVLLLFHCGSSQMRQLYVDTLNDYNDIRKISFYSASQGYVASSGAPDWVGYTNDSGHTIVRKPIDLSNVDYNGYSVNLTFGFSIEGVKAFSKDTLLAYGDYGWVPAILFSTNGGASFKLVYHSQYNPYQLSTGIMDMIFPQNGAIGYAVDADRILKTTNRGVTWSVIRTDPNSFFEFLEAVDNNNVIAFSRGFNIGKLLKTNNGGSTWSSLSIPATTANRSLTYAYFLTADIGWINVENYDQNGELYYTKDGGITWTQKNNSTFTPFPGGKMKFVNDSTGYALSGLYRVYKTTDSGKIWQPLPRNNSFTYLGFSHNDLQCFNADQLWAGGGRDFLEISTNGGGRPLPKAFFQIDTLNVYTTNTVKLVNYSKPGYQYKWFVNNVLTSTSYHSSYTHNAQSAVDSIKLIVIDGAASDTLIQYQYFSVAPPVPVPTISSFTPASGSTDYVVTITGTNFTGAKSVRFGGVDARSFTVVSATTITAIIAAGASGDVSVTTAYGTAKLAGFVYTTRLKITGFTPSSGSVGSTVYINGTNFSSTAQDNIVRIGGILATVLSASPTQIAVKIPAGTSQERISVTVGATTAYSNLPFLVTFSGGCDFTANSFAAKVESSTDVSPANIVTADLDNDGRADVITANNNGSNRLTYLRNTSSTQTISFEPKKYLTLSAGSYPYQEFCVADFDGDDKQDICAGNQQGFIGFSVFRNTSVPGSISFNTPYNKPDAYSNGAANFSAADFDGDGKPDLAGNWSQGLLVYQNKTNGNSISFSDALNMYAGNGGGQTHDCGVADVNGDGKPDVLISSNFYQHPSVSVFLNTSTNEKISFNKPIEFSLGNNDSDNRMVVTDVDGDGKPDIAVLQRRAAILSILRNTSSGSSISFAPKVDIAIAANNSDISSGDMNGDGKADLLICFVYTTSVAVFINNSTVGNIAFSAPNNVGMESYPFSYVACATDVNVDGKPDIVTTNVHLNTTTYDTAPTVAVFQNNHCGTVPMPVCEGENLTLTSNISGSRYQWQQNTGTGFADVTNNTNFSGVTTASLRISNIPATWNNYEFRCIINDTSNSSVFVIYAGVKLVPSVSISTTATSICPNTPVSFTASALNGGTNPSYQWMINGVVINNTGPALTISNLKDNDHVEVIMTSNAPCLTRDTAISNVIIITVSGTVVTPTVSISTDTTTVCSGSSVTFTATATNTGNSPVYQWQVNGNNVAGTGSSFTTNSLPDGCQVKVILNSNATCATPTSVSSNIIAMKVNSSAAPSVTISNSGGSICEGTNIVFTATPVNPGANPTYQWQLNGVNVGNNSATYSSTALKNTDEVKVIFTSGASCASHNAISSNVIRTNWITPYPVANAGQDKTICKGDAVAIGSAAISGYTYNWAPATALNSSTIAQPNANPASTTTYVVTVYNGCYSKDTVTVNVSDIPATPVITQSGNVLSSSAATGNQWYKDGNAISGATSQSHTPASNGVYTVKLTLNGCSSSFSNGINFLATGINSPALDQKLIIAPNPVSDKLIIRYAGNTTRLAFRLIDLNGRGIIQNGLFTTGCEIDMKKYSAGSYILQIVNTKTGEHVQRMIVRL